MNNKKVSTKLIKLQKKTQIWETTPTIVPIKGKTEKRKTSLFKLPKETINILNIFIDQDLVFDAEIDENIRSHSIGGGGRFLHRRTIVDKEIVAQTLLIKDWCGKSIQVLVSLEE